VPQLLDDGTLDGVPFRRREDGGHIKPFGH
jgi:hypothetical protein